MTTEYLLPRSTPEEQGVRSSGILSFIQAAETEAIGLHSFQLVRHGHIVAERWWAPYQPTDIHLLHSLSKSFTSTAAGLAIAEGLFGLDDPVISFFPDELPDALSPNLAKMSIRHLLSMSTGHEGDAIMLNIRDQEPNWARVFLSQPVTYEPGTHFAYNSGATYMVSAILQKKAGISLNEYLEPRVFEPLGITQHPWQVCPRKITVGGWGLSLTTESISKFGQMYLDKGRWQGKQIVPEDWVDLATSRHISNGTDPKNDWNQGYGFQFWRSRHGYRGDGAFGQFCIVLPEQDVVFSSTSGTTDMGRIMARVWEHLLPAMADGPLPADPGTTKMLAELPPKPAFQEPGGQPTSPMAESVSGRTYQLEENKQGTESITVRFGERETEIRIKNKAAEHVVIGVPGEWHCGETTIIPGSSRYVSVGGWTSPSRFELDVCFYESPYICRCTLDFDGGDVTWGWKMNCGFGPTSETCRGTAS